MYTWQTLTFVPFVLPVPVSKFLAFGSGDVNVVRTIHYRRDGALRETDSETDHVKIIFILSMYPPFLGG